MLGIFLLTATLPALISKILTGRRTKINNQPSNIFEEAEPTMNAKPTITDVSETIKVNGFNPTTARITHVTRV